jgi:hypothetical protein
MDSPQESRAQAQNIFPGTSWVIGSFSTDGLGWRIYSDRPSYRLACNAAKNSSMVNPARAMRLRSVPLATVGWSGTDSVAI